MKGVLKNLAQREATRSVLTPGQEFTVTERGPVVVQALGEAMVGVKLPVAA